MRLVWDSGNEEATEAAGSELAERLSVGDILLLKGDLGAGKTCFTRGITRKLHGTALAVKSPSYTILNIYEGRPEIRHFDFYRVSDGADLEELGLNDYWEDGIAIVEWPKDFCKALPGRVIDVIITDEGEDGRRIVVELPDAP